jgi:predicted amidohydrolase YtcJ
MVARGMRWSAVVSACLAGAAVAAPHAGAESRGRPARADVVLFNGKVVTVDRRFHIARALAVRDGTIVAVGSNRDVMRLAGPRTRRIDLHHHTVVPGLNDSHYHQDQQAVNAIRVQLLDARSMADVVAAVAAKVKTTAPGDWVIGASDWHESLLKEGRLPTRTDLDPVSGDNPVYLPRGGHTGVANSRALALAGITAQTPDPPNGKIVRDASGAPTGVLFDAANSMVRRALPPSPTGASLKTLLKAQFKRDLKQGLTSLTVPSSDDDTIAAYKQLANAGALPQRVHMMIGANTLAQVQDVIATHRRGRLAPNLWLDGFGELGLDGGVETGYLTDPYQVVPGEQDDPSYRGLLIMPPGGYAEKLAMLKAAAKARWRVGMHVVGDAALDVALKLYEGVNDETPLAPRRWEIMHGFLPSAADMTRLKRLHVAVTVQDHPVLLGFNMVQWWGKDRAAYTYPLDAELAKGLIIGGGSDSPVVPTNPFLSIWWMVTRDTLTSGVLGREHAISRAQALRTYTMGSAYPQFADDQVGSLETGKLADFVILSQDLLTVPAKRIPDTTALATFVGGRQVYVDHKCVRSTGHGRWDVRGSCAEDRSRAARH